LPQKQPLSLQKIWEAAPRHALLCLLCLFAAFPLYWMLISSFKPLGEILGTALLPKNPIWANYSAALSGMPFMRMTLNTIFIASAEAFLQLVTAVLAAYALTRWDFKGRGLIFSVFSLTWLIPFQAIMIPNYVTIASMGLRNTLLGVVLPFAASSFAILSIYDAFKAFPRALIEAAALDNLSELSILFRIVLPNIRASAASLAILLFINGWNEYIWAMLVAANLDNAPIQIGLQYFMSSDGFEWGPLMAAATLSCIPVVALYLILRKQIINSFVRWGIK
jgi:ABC-type glycerol-3-phosphate transport system permease component